MVIDGAHNAQKMARVPEIFKTVFLHRDVTVLIAMKEDKDTAAVIRELAPIASRFVASGFFNTAQDLDHLSEDPEQLAAKIKQAGRDVTVEADPHQALQVALDQTKDILLVTGSFYFIGEIYNELK